MASEPEEIRRARHFMAQRDRLLRKRDQMLLDAYADAQRDMEVRIERDMAKRQDQYGKVVFDEEAARMLDVEQEIEKLNPRIADLIHDGMREQVKLAAEQAETEMEVRRKAGGLSVGFGRLNKEAVDQLASRVSEPRNITQMLRGHTQQYKDKVNRTLLSQQIQGKNPREAAALLKKETGGESGGVLSRWLTVARTEMLDANRKGLTASYTRHSDILRGKERLASLDERTCMACVALDGEIYPLDAPEDGHQNCRCTWIPVMKRKYLSREDKQREKQRLRGEKWFKKQPEKVQQKMMGMQKWTYWKRDVIELKDLVVERQNHGWRPAKYEASLKDALSFYDRTPIGRLMSELKRLPGIGRIVPFLFSPADEVLLIAWHGKDFTKVLANARSKLVEDLAPGLAKNPNPNITEGQLQLIRLLANGQIRTAVHDYLYGDIYKRGMPRRIIPTLGPVRQIDKGMSSLLRAISNKLQPPLQRILLKDFEQRVQERALLLRAESRAAVHAAVAQGTEVLAATGLEPVYISPAQMTEMLWERLAQYQPVERYALSMPVDGAIKYPMIPYQVDEWTAWGPMAQDLRMASTVTPGEGFILHDVPGVVYNETLIDTTYETIIPGRIDPLRPADLANGGVFFTMNNTPGEATGRIFWTQTEEATRYTVDELKAVFQESYNTNGTVPEGWQNVGRYSRGFEPYGNSVYHSNLNLDREYEGLGFAEAWYQRSIHAYITHGIEKVRLSTAEIGAYTWAKNHLFQFTSGSALSLIRQRGAQIRDAVAAGRFTEEDLSEWLNQIVAREERNDPLRSHEFAMLGADKFWMETDPLGIPRKMHFGKMIMINNSWGGELTLAHPTETTRFGVPWPIPALFMPRYPRLLDTSNLLDLNVDVEQVIRAWIASIIIETAGEGHQVREYLQSGSRQVDSIVRRILIEPQAGITEGIWVGQAVKIQHHVEEALIYTRNLLTEDPGRVRLIDALRQAMQRTGFFTGEGLENDVGADRPAVLEEWLRMLEGTLPTQIRRPVDPGDYPVPPPPSGGPSLPSGASPRPPAPPAPAGGPTEPFRPLPPPPVINPWARTMTRAERSNVMLYLHGSIARHTGWEAEDVATFMGDADDVMQGILTGQTAWTLVRMMEEDLTISLGMPTSAQLIARELRGYLVGFLSSSPFDWASIDLWDDGEDVLTAVDRTLRAYEIEHDINDIWHAYTDNNVDMAETVRDFLYDGALASPAVVQSVYEALLFQGGMVPWSSRRLQSRPIPSRRPDYEYFELRWGALPTIQRAEGRRRLVDELTWAISDNAFGPTEQRRQQAEAMAPALADRIIEAMVQGHPPEAAMWHAWRGYQGPFAGTSTNIMGDVFQRVSGTYLFQPELQTIDAETLYEALRTTFTTSARAMANRIAAFPDRPLQIAMEEVDRYVAAQPDPVDIRELQRFTIVTVSDAAAYTAPLIEPALRERVRQIFRDTGITVGMAIAVRTMEGYFVAAVHRGMTPAVAIGEALRQSISFISDEAVAGAVTRFRERPLATPMPVIDLSSQREQAFISSIRIPSGDFPVYFGAPDVSYVLPVDEQIARLNVGRMPDASLIELVERIRAHYGRPDLVARQAAVSPIPPSRLVEPEFDADVARQIYLAYYDTRIPSAERAESAWDDYRNDEILRFPIDVDVRLRRALDIADLDQAYDLFRHNLTGFGERPLRIMIEEIFFGGGWSPEAVDHLTWLVEADPILFQYARPAPVHHIGFTIPDRGPQPNYNRDSAVIIFEQFVAPVEELYDSGREEDEVNDELQVVWESYYDGSMPLLPVEVINELDRIVGVVGDHRQEPHLQHVIQQFSGHLLPFDEVVSEWIELYHDEMGDQVEADINASPVIRAYREQYPTIQPLWQPITGSDFEILIGRMLGAPVDGPLTGPNFRSQRQREQAGRVLRGLLNRSGLAGFSQESIANALRLTYSMVDIWVSEEYILRLAESMQQVALASQTAAQIPTTPAVAPSIPRAATDPVGRITRPGVWRFTPAALERITAFLDEITEENIIEPFRTVLGELDMRIQRVTYDATADLLNIIRVRMLDRYEDIIDQNSGPFDINRAQYLGNILGAVDFWPELVMERTLALPLIQHSDNVRVPGLYRIDDIAQYGILISWGLPQEQDSEVGYVLAQQRFQVIEPGDHDAAVWDQILSAIDETAVEIDTEALRFIGPIALQLTPSPAPEPPETPTWEVVQEELHRIIPGLNQLEINAAFTVPPMGMSVSEYANRAVNRIPAPGTQSDIEWLIEIVTRQSFIQEFFAARTVVVGPEWQWLPVLEGVWEARLPGDFTAVYEPALDENQVTIHPENNVDLAPVYMADTQIFTDYQSGLAWATEMVEEFLQRGPSALPPTVATWTDIRRRLLNEFTDQLTVVAHNEGEEPDAEGINIWFLALSNALPGHVEGMTAAQVLAIMDEVWQRFSYGTFNVQNEPWWVDFWVRQAVVIPDTQRLTTRASIVEAAMDMGWPLEQVQEAVEILGGPWFTEDDISQFLEELTGLTNLTLDAIRFRDILRWIEPAPDLSQEPLTWPVQSTWRWEGSGNMWAAHLPGDYYVIFDGTEGGDFELTIWDNFETSEDPDADWSDFSEYPRGLGLAESMRLAADYLNNWLANQGVLPTPAVVEPVQAMPPVEPVLPARFPERPSDPYAEVVLEQFREEAVALRNMGGWYRLEQSDTDYRAARDVMRRYMEARLAGSNQLQALAEIIEDLRPGYSAETPTYQRRVLADLHNDFMAQLLGGSRYGAAPQQRDVAEVEEELRQAGTMQRPLGPDPEEVRILRENIDERLNAGMAPFQDDLQELADLLGQTPQAVLNDIITQTRAPVDPLSIREQIRRRMAAGFHVEPDDPYVIWLAGILGESPREVLSHIRQEMDDQPGPGTAAMPPDPLLSEENVTWTVSWEEYAQRLEAVPNAVRLQRLWNSTDNMVQLEGALRQVFLEPSFPEIDPRWERPVPGLGASLREVYDLVKFTQEQLRAQGVTHVRLHRGETFNEETIEDWVRDRLDNIGDGRFQLTGRYASSWSLFEEVATEFAELPMADYQVYLEAVVPIEQIAFMFPPFDPGRESMGMQVGGAYRTDVEGLAYPTLGEFVILGDIVADVTVAQYDEEVLETVYIEPTVLPPDARAVQILTYLETLILGLNSNTPDWLVRGEIRAAYEDTGRTFDKPFWDKIYEIRDRFNASVSLPDQAVRRMVLQEIKRTFQWIPGISQALQLTVLDILFRNNVALRYDPWNMLRVMEYWRQLVLAGVHPKEAFERSLARVRAGELLRPMEGVWRAYEWERANVHQPLQGGDVIVERDRYGNLIGIARVMYDEVIDEVEGWRLATLSYLHDPGHPVSTRIDQMGSITRGEVRWVELSGAEGVYFAEQARRNAMVGIRPGEELHLFKQAGFRSWVALYAPGMRMPFWGGATLGMGLSIRMMMATAKILGVSTVEEVDLGSYLLPPTPRIGSNILLDDSNAHLAFLDSRDDYLARLLTHFHDQPRANRVSQLYDMWKGGADTLSIQRIWMGDATLGDPTIPLPASVNLVEDLKLLKLMVRYIQGDIRRRGITHVRLFRGLTPEQIASLEQAGLGQDSVGEQVQLTGRILTSWSIYQMVGQLFARTQQSEGQPGVIMSAVVPVEQIALAYPPFPIQGPDMVELVEGEFAVLGDVEATIHSWVVPAGLDEWRRFYSSQIYIDAITELVADSQVEEALDFISAYIEEYIHLGYTVDQALAAHLEQESRIGAWPGDESDWETAYDGLVAAWDEWRQGGA